MESIGGPVFNLCLDSRGRLSHIYIRNFSRQFLMGLAAHPQSMKSSGGTGFNLCLDSRGRLSHIDISNFSEQKLGNEQLRV